LKINQVGTVSEALEAARLATANRYGITVSLRSNDTNDPFIADFAVAVEASHIKLGSPVRGERNAKYNRLIRIESDLGNNTAASEATIKVNPQ
jgi:enolase